MNASASLTSDTGVFAQVRRLLASNAARMLLTAAAVMLVIAALVMVGRSLSFDEILRTLRSAHVQWLAAAVALAIAGQAVRVMRSNRVLAWEAQAGNRAGTALVLQALTGGQLINWLSPIRAGDVWRILRLGRSGQNSLLWITGSVVLEKGADSVVLAAFGVLLLLLPLPATLAVPITRPVISIITCLMLFSAISALGSTRLRDRLLARLPKLDRWLNHALPESRAHYAPGRWLHLVGMSAIIWVSGLLFNVAVAQAFGLKIDLATHLLLMLSMQTTIVLAPVPGNIGVFPLIAMTVLGATGMAGTTAVAYGTMLYVLAYGVLLLVAAIAFAPALLRPRKTAATRA